MKLKKHVMVEYEYAVVRLIPRVDREEFLNIGVLLYCKKKRFANILWSIDEYKCKVFWSELDLDFIEYHLLSMEKICMGSKDGGPLAALDLTERFRWLTANRSTIIQCSPVHVGLCESPEETLGTLLQKMVL